MEPTTPTTPIRSVTLANQNPNKKGYGDALPLSTPNHKTTAKNELGQKVRYKRTSTPPRGINPLFSARAAYKCPSRPTRPTQRRVDRSPQKVSTTRPYRLNKRLLLFPTLNPTGRKDSNVVIC